MTTPLISPPVLIKSIQQKDNHSFTIEWSDRKIQEYRLSDLQRHCPCAKCFDTNTNRRKTDAATVNDDVKGLRIKNVGRYAIRIEFTTGCSTGIYSFAMLRRGFDAT